ncbi:MAG: hypothetical protein LBD10_11725 [Desulfobulbus sp.]|jgi:hypothetical protein|uniref:hypothetical protein n=1 Tax=Desulfobulbus sp. TaxID=895 RepID=UPI002852186E|nr:hypothetical protein [Desulfobulbus sp.]MDR2550855.1 hypothetical protein [Desulfobulbus sp.]
MKIAESAIQLASSRTAIEHSERQESLTVWRPDQETARTESRNGANDAIKQQADQLAREAAKVSLSEAAKQQRTVVAAKSAETDDSPLSDDPKTDLNLRILKTLFEKLTGRKFKTTEVPVAQQAAQAQAPAQEGGQGGQLPPGWGMRYESHETYHEAESTTFDAKGTVLTTDGQQIEIDIQLNMSRSFTATIDEVLQIRRTEVTDPLVINFNGTAAQLTQKTFSFDIDTDGTDNQIAFVGPGSGFLALDANNDGMINNGSELFGTKSGDGFADLAAYDNDHNGWIDENDSIFSRLRIWMKTESGEDKLLTLKDQGVGAIYLGRIDTPFSVKDDSNALQGQVRATGLFLFEKGGTGTMQQLDLVA